MLKKGIYPYEYIDGKEKLGEVQLPPKEKFYSSLSGTNIFDEDYEHAQKVWKTFACQTLADYTELYCKSDVLLLADVFENFINVSLEKYKLDPSHYMWPYLQKRTLTTLGSNIEKDANKTPF